MQKEGVHGWSPTLSWHSTLRKVEDQTAVARCIIGCSWQLGKPLNHRVGGSSPVYKSVDEPPKIVDMLTPWCRRYRFGY